MNIDLFTDIPVLRLERGAPEKNGATLTAHLDPTHIRNLATRLLTQKYFLEDISMLDVTEGYLAVYHFDRFDLPGRIVLRILVPREEHAIPTISDIFQGASWHERECRDFFGIQFVGHENLIPLLLPAEASIHPLRKEDADRKSIAEIFEPGEVLREDPGFSLFAAKAGEKQDAEAETS
jgi:NADH-quinone oxidoreductase subunit C